MAKKKMKKTNALRILDQLNIEYNLYEYDFSDEQIDGESVANKIGKDKQTVFKTLVCKSGKEHFAYVIPVMYNLNLKKAAKVSGVKKVEMIPLKTLLPTTGYVHGGCSPIGMKKQFQTYFHEDVILLDTIVFSAGLRGLQVEVPSSLVETMQFTIADLV